MGPQLEPRGSFRSRIAFSARAAPQSADVEDIARVPGTAHLKETAMPDTSAHDQITRAADMMQRSIDGLTAQFQRCRDAANDLAAAIAALPESDAKTALYPAYEAFMQQDSGNFT